MTTITPVRIPIVRFTPDTISTMRCQLAPITAPRVVMPPYQIADAMPIGTRVRATPSPTSPANGGTTARMPGRKRLRKMPIVPKRRYSRSMMASERGARSRRPAWVAKRRGPYRRAARYTPAAPRRFAIQVTRKTANGVVTCRWERNAPSATAASDGIGGSTFSTAARRARTE